MLSTSSLSGPSKAAARRAIREYMLRCVDDSDVSRWSSLPGLDREFLAEAAGRDAALMLNDLGGLAAAW